MWVLRRRKRKRDLAFSNQELFRTVKKLKNPTEPVAYLKFIKDYMMFWAKTGVITKFLESGRTSKARLYKILLFQPFAFP